MPTYLNYITAEIFVTQDIKMPPKQRKRGRPKGAGLTVVGLPNKKKRNGPIPFTFKSKTLQAKGSM